MLTIKLPHTTDISALDDFRRSQSAVYRQAYVLAANGKTEKEIRHALKNRNTGVADSWLIQSAIKKAVGDVKSETELDKKNTTSKLGKRIFGGKGNFVRRSKGLISSEEYQQKRLLPFYSIGESPHKGNRKVIFNAESIVIKPKKGVKVEIQLPKLKGKYKKYYDSLAMAVHNKELPVTVHVDTNFVYLAFDESLLATQEKKKVISGRYLGIDLNPNYIGVSFFDENKKLLEAKLYDFKSLTGKNINHDKLKHEIREVAIQIGKLSQHYQIEWLFVEDLKFDQGNKKKGKNYNRLTSNQFLYKEFTRMLSKFGKTKSVNAAYSSTIGNICHENHPDPIAASIEIARRGIESRVVRGGCAFYPPLVAKEVLQNRWKEEVIPDFTTWVELHSWLKTTGLKYRVDLPSKSMFRIFTSRKSDVLTYGFIPQL